jgi:hypothetical protein
MKSTVLIESIRAQVAQFISIAKELKNRPIEYLERRPSKDAWNTLECLSHLNRYSDYYLPAIEKKITGQSMTNETDFKSGLIGGYMAKMILPKEKLNKIKTFAEMNPINSMLGKEEIDVFIENQKKLILLLDLSSRVSLTKTMIPTTISKLIKMRLGDAFQFLANHTLRHIKQIENLGVN